MSRRRIGSKVKVIERISPKWLAGCSATVIAFQEFARSTPATDAKYSGWRLKDIQEAVFIRYLDGRQAGKVDMMAEDCLENRK